MIQMIGIYDTKLCSKCVHIYMHERPCMNFYLNSLCCSTLIVAFHEACSLGFTDVVRTFLECTGESDDLITQKGANGTGLNVLQNATLNKRSLVVQILLKRLKLPSHVHACTCA